MVYNSMVYSYLCYIVAALGWLKLSSMCLLSQAAGVAYIRGMPFSVQGGRARLLVGPHNGFKNFCFELAAVI